MPAAQGRSDSTMVTRCAQRVERAVDLLLYVGHSSDAAVVFDSDEQLSPVRILECHQCFADVATDRLPGPRTLAGPAVSLGESHFREFKSALDGPPTWDFSLSEGDLSANPTALDRGVVAACRMDPGGRRQRSASPKLDSLNSPGSGAHQRQRSFGRSSSDLRGSLVSLRRRTNSNGDGCTRRSGSNCATTTAPAPSRPARTPPGGGVMNVVSEGDLELRPEMLWSGVPCSLYQSRSEDVFEAVRVAL